MNLILKILSTSIVGLALLFSLMAVQARDTEASTSDYGQVVSKGAPVNVRAGKGTDTAIVGKAKNGEKLRILESAGEWYKVKLSNGKTGYIRSDFLKAEDQTKATDKPKTTDKATSGKGVGVVTASTLNIRADKDSGAELVGKLKKGEKLQVLDGSGEWYQVKLNNGKVGYAFGNYIKMGATEVDTKATDGSKDDSASKDAGSNNQKTGVVTTQSAALRIRADKNLNAKVVGTVAKGAKVKILEKSGKWYKVELDDGTQGYANSQYLKSEGEPDHLVQKLDKPSTDSSATSVPSKEGVVTTKSAPLNIRATKDPKGKVMGKADKGTKVKILEKTGDWYKIKLKNGTTGYASSQFIQVGTTAKADQGDNQGDTGIVTTKSAPLNIRADQDASANIVGKANKGSTVQILEKAGEWYKVKLEDGTTGYANSQFIRVGTTTKDTQGEEGTVITKNAPLNIRADKDAAANIVGKADKGSTVQIVEKTGEWYKVKLEDGTTGYASSQFIQVGTDNKDENADQPADKVSMAKTSKGDKNYGVVTTKSAPLNIRATKARDAKIVGKADKDSKLLILEKSGEWYKVQLKNGTKGYASSQFIKEEE